MTASRRGPHQETARRAQTAFHRSWLVCVGITPGSLRGYLGPSPDTAENAGGVRVASPGISLRDGPLAGAAYLLMLTLVSQVN